MASRNFRASYLSSLGFQSLEIKRSLESLLAETDIDVAKIKQLCLQVGLPEQSRRQVWSLLLGVLPTCTSSGPFVQRQRSMEYFELRRTVKLLEAVHSHAAHRWPVSGLEDIYDPSTNPSVSHACERILSVFWLCRELARREGKYSLSMAKEVRLCPPPASGPGRPSAIPSDAEVFLPHAGVVAQLLSAIQDEALASACLIAWSKQSPELVVFSGPQSRPYGEAVETILRSADAELLEHLYSLSVRVPYLVYWMLVTCFTTVLEPQALLLVFDRLMCGSEFLQVYISAAVFVCIRNRLLGCGTATAVMDVLNKTQKINADTLFKLAGELSLAHPAPTGAVTSPPFAGHAAHNAFSSPTAHHLSGPRSLEGSGLSLPPDRASAVSNATTAATTGAAGVSIRQQTGAAQVQAPLART